VRELRFDKGLYPGEQVDAAVKVFARYGRLETRDDDASWIVAITAKTPAHERRLAGELGNYALGLTLRHRQR